MLNFKVQGINSITNDNKNDFEPFNHLVKSRLGLKHGNGELKPGTHILHFSPNKLTWIHNYFRRWLIVQTCLYVLVRLAFVRFRSGGTILFFILIVSFCNKLISCLIKTLRIPVRSSWFWPCFSRLQYILIILKNSCDQRWKSVILVASVTCLPTANKWLLWTSLPSDKCLPLSFCTAHGIKLQMNILGVFIF